MKTETVEGRKFKDVLAGERGTVLALFVADWCGYCRRLREELAGAKLGVRKLVEVDVSDEDDPAWEEWGIELVPTAVIFRAGVEVGRKPPASFRGLAVDEVRALCDAGGI
ncbi:MAG: thioredoxin family protein [Deltaproteobacteria bacterium]|nr:thioredoxin family protein [Deltaproteobacteria bacterium]